MNHGRLDILEMVDLRKRAGPSSHEYSPVIQCEEDTLRNGQPCPEEPSRLQQLQAPCRRLLGLFRYILQLRACRILFYIAFLVSLFLAIHFVRVVLWMRAQPGYPVRYSTGPPETLHDWLLYRDGFSMNVPTWMQKDVRLKQQPETELSLCFVHVGKTAGTTLLCDFGFLSTECFLGDNQHPMAQGLLPLSVKAAIHAPFDGCHSFQPDYYLFVLRNPLKRLQSWFTYERPAGVHRASLAGSGRYQREAPLFIECGFSTLNELGELGLSLDSEATDHFINRQTNETIPQPTLKKYEKDYFTSDGNGHDEFPSICQFRAHMAIRGEIGYASHNKYNFHYYKQWIEEQHHTANPPIAAIRTEHLEKDWKGLEENLLHGPKDLNVTFGVMNKSKKSVSDKFLSSKAMENICRELCADIQIYKELLRKAVNLDKEDVKTSLDELEKSCPEQVQTSHCV